MILSDNETKVDLLNNEAIAKTIIQLLKDHSQNPITIGVHGDWGAGKSSVLEMIEDSLSDEENTFTIKFNGWRFQGFEDAKIALIEAIVTGLIENRPTLTKAGDVVKETLKRIDWLKLARHAGGLAFTAATGIPTPDQIGLITDALKSWVSDPAKLATKENIEGVANSVGGLLKPAQTKHIPQEIQEFRKAFDDLLDAAKIDHLIVLVDDLDRCLPKTAIETLEAIRLFVFTQRTAFVIAADEAMIEYAVREHFPDLPDTTGPRDYARNYLEKLIQVPFRIPSLGETETRIYIALLLIGASLPDGNENFNKLIASARTLLQRPWDAGMLDPSTIKTALGEDFEIGDAVQLSDQIGPILAKGSSGNPRQIKRFLNTLLLRQTIAEARGFGADINLPVLGKLMLAERFYPILFDQIAQLSAASGDGKCQDLKTLETTQRSGSKASSSKPSDLNESSVAAEWIKSEGIKEWAEIEPNLADVDLRPYLFVAKDRKDYFGGASILGKLAQVAQDLLRSKLEVRGMLSDLQQLASPEAEQIFELVRQRILSRGEYDKQPSGVDGLIILTQAQTNLETKLIGFVENLPADKLGAWAVQGWGTAITSDDAKKRLSTVIEKWSKNTKNVALSAAASVTNKPIKK